ncbi:transporter [Pandoraea sp. XJJ-1]|uniref:transporter n=1 Tax=Pandoraea sp. XJJ-1 TaxID=3002643 RepID=UPI002281CC4A|nr:transporter [Pandoraea sp. XJJ-1]WAL81811.1 transporter [Pandoraea sp. XJJ-1]
MIRNTNLMKSGKSAETAGRTSVGRGGWGKWGRVFAALAVAGAVPSAHAVVETDPGDYVPLPAGTNLAILYYQHAYRTSLYSSGNRLDTPFKLSTDVALARYVHYFDVAGFRANVQAILPFASVRLQAPVASSANGVGDPMLGAVVWMLNHPDTQRALALSAFVSLPAGSYDASRGSINVGENRWKGVFQLTYTQPIASRLYLDVTGEYAVYGKNNDFAGLNYQQKASYEVQTHLRYVVTPRTTLGLSYYQTMGGRSTLGGVDQNNRINTGRYLVTLAHFVTPTWQLQGQVGQDLHVSNGPKENFRVNLRLVKVF